jgi:NADH-quinone oxidoreductase subunit H
MTWETVVPLLLHVGKAVFVVMFGLNLGVVLTWMDRRQGAMMQDRVGPNRAVIWLPKPVAIAAAVLPALGAAAGVLLFAFIARAGATQTVDGAVVDATVQLGTELDRGWAMLFSHLAVFMLWVTTLVVAGRVRARGIQNGFDGFVAAFGDPRRIFFAGLVAHALLAFAGVATQGTAGEATLTAIGLRSGPLVLVAAILFGAGYAAYSMARAERVGLRLAGLLHPAADGLKTLFKEDFVPPGSDKLLHGLAPFIAFFPTLVLLACVPFGDTLCFATKASGALDLSQVLAAVPRDGVCMEGAVPLQVTNLDVGILYVFAVSGTGIVGAALAGWASNNKYSLLGGLRAASQMVSYEVTLGLTVIGALMIYGDARFDKMVEWQGANTWGIFVQPVAAVLFLAASLAESKRIPFDLPEGESEIVAGYFTEYSGMKFAMFFFSEYIAVVVIGALMATMFFGGWHVPFLERDGFYVVLGERVLWEQPLHHVAVVVIGFVAFILKVVILCWLQLTIRWTLPRFRYDQLMNLGWKMLLPASLVNILLTGLVILAIQDASPTTVNGLTVVSQVTNLVVAAGAIAGFVALVLFLVAPSEKRRSPNTSAARFAAVLGDSRTTSMGA